MNPGMSEQAATLHYQALVARGLHEQFVASVRPSRASAPAFRTALHRRLGALLVRVRVCLQDVHSRAEPWPAPSAAGERGASASSDEPMAWLSPCRLP